MKRNIKNIFSQPLPGLVILFLLSFTGFSQTNYFVCPTGDDGNSGLSLQDSWQSIQRAADVLQPGDTVFIKSGIYHEIVIPANSGSSENFITYTVYPGDTAIIDGTNFANCYLHFSDRAIFDIKDSVSYINVIGLTVRNSNATGIAARRGAHNINFLYNIVTQCQAPGISAGYGLPLGRGTNITAIGNLVDSCALHTRESISFRSVDTFEISHNIVTNSPQLGIDVKSGCSNGVIFKNYVSNAWPGIYIDAGHQDTAYESQHNIHVYQNIVFNCRTGIAIASESGNLGENIWIYNNIIYDTPEMYNSRDGIVVANYEQSGPLKDIYIINNTIYGKGHRGIYINNLNVENIVIRNNICSHNIIAQIDIKSDLISGVSLENNLIDGITEDYGENAVVGDPMFVDVNSGNFRLLQGSPAINNGSEIDSPDFDFDGNPRPIGEGFDIGAFEFNTASEKLKINGNKQVSIYPNPTSNEIFIETDLPYFNTSVYTLKGQLILSKQNKKHIKLDNLPSGMYVLCVDNQKSRVLTEIIIIAP